jgi:hypothetical protein
MTKNQQLAFFKQQAEDAYAKMYDAIRPSDAAACYSDAKEALYSAIGIARRLRRTDDLARLEARLAHVKAVFRSQFT